MELDFIKIFGKLYHSPFNQVEDIQDLSKRYVTTNLLLDIVNKKKLWEEGFFNSNLPLVRERISGDILYRMYPLIKNDLVGFTVVIIDTSQTLFKYFEVNIIIAITPLYMAFILKVPVEILNKKLRIKDKYNLNSSLDFYKESAIRSCGGK